MASLVAYVASPLAAATKGACVRSALFKDLHTVIGCTGFVAGRSIQLELARAALDSGVRRYFPWQFGVDYDAIGRGSAQDLFDVQLDVRDLLRSQDRLEWVIVSTSGKDTHCATAVYRWVKTDIALTHL
jgi:NmrA-like family